MKLLKPISAKTRYILHWMKCVSHEKRCIFQVQRCIFQLVRGIILIWRPPDRNIHLTTGEMYYSYLAAAR